jgi:hypothetical protein
MWVSEMREATGHQREVRSSENISITGNIAGMCLTEILIAMAAALVVLTAVLETIQSCDRMFRAHRNKTAHQQELRVALDLLNSELKTAVSSKPSQSPIHESTATSLAFDANLSGLITKLTRAVGTSDVELPVEQASGWPSGKRLVVCQADRCAEGRLARDGTRRLIVLAAPLGQEFADGSTVFVLNRVRYYSIDAGGRKVRVMRAVDGGVGMLVEGIARFDFSHWTEDGRPAAAPGRVARVRVRTNVTEESQPIEQDFGVRAS